jgi:hypothetical protein
MSDSGVIADGAIQRRARSRQLCTPQPCPAVRGTGDSAVAGLFALVLIRRGLLRLAVDPLLHAVHHRFADADLLGDLAHRHAGLQQGRDPQPVGVLHVLHAPGRLAVAGLEPGLERLDLLAVDAARLLDVDLEARALGVVARPAQAGAV